MRSMGWRRMDQSPNVRLAIPLVVTPIICLAIGAAAIQGPKIGIPIALAAIFVIATLINLASRLLLKRRGQVLTPPVLWVVLVLGGVFAALLLGVAAALTWLFGIPGRDLLIHAEALLLVWFAVIHVAGTALLNVAALLCPTPANR